MIFNKEELAVSVIYVLEMEQKKKETCHTKARDFSTLSYRITADSLLHTPQQTLSLSDHSILFVPKQLDYSRTAQNERMIVAHFHLYGADQTSMEAFLPRDPLPYQRQFEELLSVWNRKEPGCRLKCSELLTRIFRMIYREQQLSEGYARWAATIIRQEHENPAFSVCSLPDRLGISGTYLRKQFLQEYGTTMADYLVQARLEHACFLLSAGNYSVRKIAEECGFANEKYFSALFKKRMGLSPKQY